MNDYKFKPGNYYKTVGGNKAKVMSILPNGKMTVHVFSSLGRYMDKEHKYTLNGHYWCDSTDSYDDLVAE